MRRVKTVTVDAMDGASVLCLWSSFPGIPLPGSRLCSGTSRWDIRLMATRKGHPRQHRPASTSAVQSGCTRRKGQRGDMLPTLRGRQLPTGVVRNLWRQEERGTVTPPSRPSLTGTWSSWHSSRLKAIQLTGLAAASASQVWAPSRSCPRGQQPCPPAWATSERRVVRLQFWARLPSRA